jgi:hypothetical protein
VKISGKRPIIINTTIGIKFIRRLLMVGLCMTPNKSLEATGVLFIVQVFFGGRRKMIIRIGRTMSTTITAISSVRSVGMIGFRKLVKEGIPIAHAATYDPIGSAM